MLTSNTFLTLCHTNPIVSHRCVFCLNCHMCNNYGTAVTSTIIKDLYEPSETPSSVNLSAIEDNQLDASRYSPCENSFTLIAHCLGYQTLPAVRSDRLVAQINTTLSDLREAMAGSCEFGYCSQKNSRSEASRPF